MLAVFALVFLAFGKRAGGDASWRAVLGAAILVLVLAFPGGVAGYARRWLRS